MADPALRHLALLQLIPRRAPGLTTAELQSMLNDRGYSITLRSIQRDLTRLSTVFSLTHDDGKPPRWSWSPDVMDLSLPSQDPFSAMTWQLIEQYLTPILPHNLRRAAEPQFRAARGFLEASGAKQFQRWTERVRIHPRTMPLLAPRVEERLLEAIYQGLLECHQIRVRYQGRNDRDSREMTIHPQALVLRDGLMYLLVMIGDYTDIRQTVLHRYHEAELLDAPAREAEGFNLDQYISQGGFDYAHGRDIDLVAQFNSGAGHHLLESPLTEDQVAQPRDQGILEVRATVADSEQLRWWLLGFGSQVEVIEPEPLRDFMREHLKSMMEVYGMAEEDG